MKMTIRTLRSYFIQFFSILLVVTMISTEIRAMLVDLDTTTLDTTTNLEWRDVTATAGLTLSEALSQNPTFRHATRDEVLSFWKAGGILNVGEELQPGWWNAEELAFINMIGGFNQGTRIQYQTGSYDDIDGNSNSHGIAVIGMAQPGGKATTHQSYLTDGFVGADRFFRFGHYLVRPFNQNQQPIPQYSFNLKRGWNQIGGPVRTVSREDLETSVKIWPVFYHYENGRFRKNSTLEYGKGYWLYSYGEGKLTLRDEEE